MSAKQSKLASWQQLAADAVKPVAEVSEKKVKVILPVEEPVDEPIAIPEEPKLDLKKLTKKPYKNGH